MIGIAGHHSTIAQEFSRLLPAGEEAECHRLAEMPLTFDRYLICSGFLAGRALPFISEDESVRTWKANFVEPATFCDRLFALNESARVCIIGSESGFRGSYDMAYAGSKAALHLYVETKRLEHPGQQLVCIAPTIIWDSAMTRRRDDLAALEARAAATRHGRWLTAREVAEVAMQALCGATTFQSNAVIRLRGEVP